LKIVRTSSTFIKLNREVADCFLIQLAIVTIYSEVSNQTALLSGVRFMTWNTL